VIDERRHAGWGGAEREGEFEVPLGLEESGEGEWDVIKLHVRMEAGAVLGDPGEVIINGCFLVRREREEEEDDDDEIVVRVQKGVRVVES
jgi:hypothetical protein